MLHRPQGIREFAGPQLGECTLDEDASSLVETESGCLLMGTMLCDGTIIRRILLRMIVDRCKIELRTACRKKLHLGCDSGRAFRKIVAAVEKPKPGGSDDFHPMEILNDCLSARAGACPPTEFGPEGTAALARS